MNTTIRQLMIGLLLLALLTACGGQAATQAPDAVTTDPPRNTLSPTNAAGAETRTIRHAMGETEVQDSPQRVVVLDTGELDSVLALGITPVGAVTAIAKDGVFPNYLQDRIANIELVGTTQEPNLEKIAALQPDLILSSKLRHEEIYDELSQIAPTVFSEAVGVVWKENLLLNAEALGKKAEAEQLLADYQARLEALQQA
ncbi:MAG: iron-siderophore ABC transporter substrate-binding protein, partial [Chloroflexales bacterium]|nr:iron-siderophore ABC transporter substrate-binding protein [Chloroflexales bacterium]